jgi:glycosyltransferase involved in cell wall biosynthesis
MNAAFWPSVVEIAAWGVALAWCARTTDALRNLPGVANLIGLEWDVAPEGSPSLTVIVPARDEAANIEATLDTLMQQDYANLRVVAVNDRSSDKTGRIMNRFAKRFPKRLTVVHVRELPPGWLGKVHAMAEGLAASESEYVLFTDADVLFSPSVLRRALVYAQMEQADQLVVAPTMQVKSWGEGVILGFFQVFSLWVARPWRVSDPKAMRDTVGIGAFNMLRRDALEKLGGLEPQRLVVLEDVTLGRRIKAAGMRQRMAFAPGLVLVHWAAGVRGLMHVMSKNVFSAFNFRPALALLACVWIAMFCVAPLVGIFWWGTIIPALLVAACVSVGYRLYGQLSWISARFGWAYPLGAVAIICAVVRSVVVVWKDGGVKWRGTLYPLRELRRHNSPLRWRRKEV